MQSRRGRHITIIAGALNRKHKRDGSALEHSNQGHLVSNAPRLQRPPSIDYKSHLYYEGNDTLRDMATAVQSSSIDSSWAELDKTQYVFFSALSARRNGTGTKGKLHISTHIMNGRSAHARIHFRFSP
jgi:hypothetical protein